MSAVRVQGTAYHKLGVSRKFIILYFPLSVKVKFHHRSPKCNIKHLMTGPDGNSEFYFPRISMFPETKSRETLRFEGNKIHFSPRDQSLSDLLYSKTKQKQNLKTAL